MSASSSRLRVLLLCDDNPRNANTMLDHIRAFRAYSRHSVWVFNPRGIQRPSRLDFNEFDVVVVHWSLSLIHDHYVHRTFRDPLAQFRGLKVQFLQDDYRWVEIMTAEQRRLGINVLFTLVSPEHFDKIWTSRLPGVRLESTLAGYVPENLLDRPVKPMGERPLDIVYRGREVPWWLGRLGQDKVLVGRGVKALAENAGLKVDIAWTERERIYGERWVQFLGESRTTIGCEGGASITDFDGSAERAVINYRQQHPDATFDEVHAAVLAPYEGNVPMNVMTPRLFEAAALRTALVLFPGRYCDVLEPWRHYIPLEKNFSNFDDAARLIRDDAFLTELTERTYREVASSPANSTRAMVAHFDRVVDEEARTHTSRPMVGYALTLGEARFRRMAASSRVAVGNASERSWNAAARVPLLGWRAATHTPVLRYPRHYAIRAYASLGAAARTRERAALIARSLVTPSRETSPNTQVLLEDMLKFDILCTARRGAGRSVGYAVSPYLRGDGTLEFKSFASGEPNPGSAEVDNVIEAIKDGHVTRVVWDHSAVGDKVYVRLFGSQVAVWLVPSGRHEFISFGHLLRSDLPSASRIIRQAFPEPGKGRRTRTPRRLFPAGTPDQLRQLVRDPSGYMVRAYVMARLIATNRAYLQILATYITSGPLRSAVTVDAVMADLLRIEMLRRSVRAADGFEVHLRRDLDGQWSYVSVPVAAAVDVSLAGIVEGVPASVTWDHSAVSDSLDVQSLAGRRISISLGANGVYAFNTLVAIATVAPQAVASVLPYASDIVPVAASAAVTL